MALRQDEVDGLSNISSMDEVMVRVAKLAVASLQGEQEAIQDLRVDLKLGDEVILLQQLITDKLQRMSIRYVVYSKYIEWPVI